MTMLNRIILMGRLTKTPELRHTQNGTAVASFTLAVERNFGYVNDGRPVDFIDIIAWRGTGEFAAKYFTKGRMAVVEGRLQMRDWTDKNGNKLRAAEVVADNVYFADSPKDSPKYDAPAYTDPPKDWQELTDDDGNLPF